MCDLSSLKSWNHASFVNVPCVHENMIESFCGVWFSLHPLDSAGEFFSFKHLYSN